MWTSTTLLALSCAAAVSLLYTKTDGVIHTLYLGPAGTRPRYITGKQRSVYRYVRAPNSSPTHVLYVHGDTKMI